MLGGGVLYGKKTQMLFNQGKNLYAARNYTEAKDALKCSFIYFPDYNTAMLIGEVYDELQRSDSAEYYWRMASDMIPYRVVPHFRLFKLYQKTDIEKAYREALQIRNMPVKVYAPHLNEIYKEVDDFLKDYCFHCFS
jgi:O-antigen polymerase